MAAVSLRVKLAPEPEVLLTSASREPAASLTTLAVSPKELVLMADTSCVREFDPLGPKLKVVCVPVPSVMVRFDEPRGELGLANEGE